MAFQIEFQPTGRRTLSDRPTSILKAAQEAGIGLQSICGGKGTCGKCIVRIAGQQLSVATAREADLLLPDEIREGYRLACSAVVSGDVKVFVPAASSTTEQRMQIAGTEGRVAVSPPVRKHFVRLSRASLTDIRSDFARVRNALKEKFDVDVAAADLKALRTLGPTLRDSGWALTVAVRGDEIIAFEPSDTTSRGAGLAIDVGTTKIAVYLVDLSSGETIDARGILNPQIAYGEDVISRIEAIAADGSSLSSQRTAVVTAINVVAQAMCENRGLRPEDILEFSLVGNTVMHHVFLGLPTSQLAVSPFVPTVITPMTVKARDLGLKAAPGAYLYAPPLVAGFIGSDLVATLLATAWCTEEGHSLVVDMGTNTEIALRTGGEVLACSCSCGPAFEGAHIDFGMRASPGAVERVRIEDSTLEVHVATVGGRAPQGLCGSGILDCIAEMLRVGLVDHGGHLQTGWRGVRVAKDGQSLEFLLVGKKEGDEGRDITISQHDIQMVQLAKGAIRAGIEVLLAEAGLGKQQLDAITIAGAFGTYLDPANAIRIGLLPDLPLERIHFVGNAAGVGAKLTLVSDQKRKEATTLANRIRYIELAGNREFARRLARSVRFDGCCVDESHRQSLRPSDQPSTTAPAAIFREEPDLASLQTSRHQGLPLVLRDLPPPIPHEERKRSAQRSCARPASRRYCSDETARCWG